MGGGEIVLIIFVFLMLFGAKAIPDIARTLGKAMREFQKATNEIKREINESGGGFGDDIRDIKSTIQNVKSDIQEGVKKHTSDIQDGIKETTSNIQEGYDGYAEYAGDFKKKVSNAKNEVVKETENITKTIHEEAKGDYNI
jgi:sec-independent protein translocase protein TatA